MNTLEFTKRTKRFLEKKEPFFFLINFDKSIKHVYSYKEALERGILFNIKGNTNFDQSKRNFKPLHNPLLDVNPFPFKSYMNGFEKVVQHLKKGNSFLVNLTFPSKIISPIHLESVFWNANAPYKLLFQDQFVCFSPECFIRIQDDHVFSYPMKGTVDATLEGAAASLMDNSKEKQEHHTIVDLIRNDLSMIARNVTLTKFRYLEKIKTAKGEIWQTSSEIRGQLPPDWKENFGELLLKMLPAGSISGAPKTQTLNIIESAENYKRGYYTGIFGIFDGNTIDTGVAIRFIEKKENTFWYKSGGGITHQSNVKEEYIELIKKIYIPTI